MLVKLSGGAFSGASDFGFDKARVEQLEGELLDLAQDGVQVVVVVGGGNIFRGRLAE